MVNLHELIPTLPEVCCYVLDPDPAAFNPIEEALARAEGAINRGEVVLSPTKDFEEAACAPFFKG